MPACSLGPSSFLAMHEINLSPLGVDSPDAKLTSTLEVMRHMALAYSEPENIRAFNWLALKVLNDLYDAFPEPINIEGLRFILSTLLDVGPESEQAKYLGYFTETVRWLKAEGFIKYESNSSGDFRKVVLTLKGLTVLGFVPVSLSPIDFKKPMITRIKRVLAKGAEAAAADAVRGLLVKLCALALSGM